MLLFEELSSLLLFFHYPHTITCPTDSNSAIFPSTWLSSAIPANCTQWVSIIKVTFIILSRYLLVHKNTASYLTIMNWILTQKGGNKHFSKFAMKVQTCGKSGSFCLPFESLVICFSSILNRWFCVYDYWRLHIQFKRETINFRIKRSSIMLVH